MAKDKKDILVQCEECKIRFACTEDEFEDLNFECKGCGSSDLTFVKTIKGVK